MFAILALALSLQPAAASDPVADALVDHESCIWELPPPASTWHWAQFECRYDFTRAVRSGSSHDRATELSAARL